MIENITQAITEHIAELIKRAEIAEKHLRIAEKALIEKDGQIAILKRGLNQRDAKIKSQEEAIEKWQAIVDQKNSDNSRLNSTVKALSEQLAKKLSAENADREKDDKIKELEEYLTVVKNANEKWKNIHTANRARIKELEQIIQNYEVSANSSSYKYVAALRDLEGTLCAASDHLKELSNSVHKVIE